MLPGSSAYEYLAARYHAGDPVATPAPALYEVVYGWSRRADQRAENSLRFLTDKIAGGALAVLPVGFEAAILAGRVRAVNPGMPRKRKGDRRSAVERRLAWRMDTLIAATAYAAGYSVATGDTAHFERIAEAVERLLPQGPPLEITGSPF